jgi:hypothetical protein
MATTNPWKHCTWFRPYEAVKLKRIGLQLKRLQHLADATAVVYVHGHDGGDSDDFSDDNPYICLDNGFGKKSSSLQEIRQYHILKINPEAQDSPQGH